MRWRDAVELAARGVLRRPGRAALTVLAVALASALLTALLAIARTAEARVLDQLADGGPLAGIKVAAAEPDPGQVDQDDARPGPPRDLDDEALDRIEAVPGVASVVPVVGSRVRVLPPDPPVAPASGVTASAPDMFTETVIGVDLRRIADLPVTVLAGRLPAPGSLSEVAVSQGYLERLDLEREEAPAVLGTELTYASPRFFGGGEEIVRGRWVRTEIVGVVAQEAAPGMVLASEEQATAARNWTLGGAQPDEDFDVSPYSGVFVIARGLDRVPEVRQAITDIGYSTSAPENLIASVQRYLRVVGIVLGAIGLIALAIACLGITNAMLAAVRERRREIGVLKAIGARDRDVLRVFLTEAAALGLAGGLLGTAVGWTIALTVSRVVNRYLTSEGLPGVALAVPFPLLAGGVLGAGLLALAAGAAPALRAARLPAREAVEV
jgi:macrolide transport system ATP-binding/permease protein